MQAGDAKRWLSRWPLTLAALGCVLGTALLFARSQAGATPPSSNPAEAAGQRPPSGATGATGTSGPSGPSTANVKPIEVAPGIVQEPVSEVPPTVRVEFVTIPPTNATVRWGKARLGLIGPRKSLVIVRPRDSGPLDVVVTADGFLPVHTRAHTFGDSKVAVKLTTPEEISTLIGYRAPIDAGVPPTGDGGMPPPAPVPTPGAVPPSAFDSNGMPRLP